MVLCRSGTVPEPPTLVARLDDVAMMGEAVEQGRGHFCIAEHTGPFPEGQVRGHRDGRAFIELADEMEQQLAAGLGKGQVAELVELC